MLYQSNLCTLAALSLVAGLCCCAGPNSNLPKGKGPPRDINPKAGQVWSGKTTTDTGMVGDFDLLISTLDSSGGFTGFVKLSLPLWGSGKAEGRISGSKLYFMVNPEAHHTINNMNFQSHSEGQLTDYIRGVGEIRFVDGSKKITSFYLLSSSVSANQFMPAYHAQVEKEKKEGAYVAQIWLLLYNPLCYNEKQVSQIRPDF